MADVEVKYRGQTIRSMSASGTEVLHTEGKLCDDDITIDYTSPGGGGANLQTKSVTYTPDETGITDTVLPDPGYDGLDEVDVTVAAIPDTYIGSAIVQRSSADLSVMGRTVTAPAGYYSLMAAAQVAAGTAGTPTASKGAVSNHSVDVTPSVTNTTGYITGSTETGTPVTVTAAELVSGSQTVTVNDTYDVTNLAEMVVNVSGGGASDTYGDPITMAMGGVNYINAGGVQRLIHDATQPTARRSLWSKTGDYPPNIYISSSNWQTLANFYPFTIASGVTKVSIIPSKTVQIALQCYYYDSNAAKYVLISDSGWMDLPISNYALSAGTEYVAIGMRVNSSNTAFSAQNQPDYVQIVFS